MEKNIITSLRNISAFISEKTLNKLGKIKVDGELYLSGLEFQGIRSACQKINEYNEKIEEYEHFKMCLTHLRGFVYLEQGKPAEAHEDFRYVRNSDYSDYEARSEAIFFSGLANIQLGNIDKGIKILNEYLEHNETSADVVYWLGVAYYLLNDLDTAEKYFNSAIGQDPGFEKAYFFRGKIHIKQGKWEEAMLGFHMALELNPENAEAQDFIGLVESIRDKFNR